MNFAKVLRIPSLYNIFGGLFLAINKFGLVCMSKLYLAISYYNKNWDNEDYMLVRDDHLSDIGRLSAIPSFVNCGSNLYLTKHLIFEVFVNS